jgi:hypothetical protein
MSGRKPAAAPGAAEAAEPAAKITAAAAKIVDEALIVASLSRLASSRRH